MKRKNKGGLSRELAASFLRGTIATGLLSALQDKREGKDLLRSALLGGAALSTAVGVEQWLFNKELKLGKKKKSKSKDVLAGLDRAGLEALLGRKQSGGLASLGTNQQFLMGAVIGAAAAYLLTDEKLRAKLIRAGMQLYTGMAGGLEEIKEQMADIQAEMAAGQDEA